eukprot:jgi/Phyca11/16775/fgenesh1_pg.PHYCAscaffold_22_\
MKVKASTTERRRSSRTRSPKVSRDQALDKWRDRRASLQEKRRDKMPTYRLDADGDVEMSIPQPVYEFVSAPELNAWDQESLVNWKRERERYVEKIQQKCRTSNEPFDAAVMRPMEEITDADIMAKVEIERLVLLQNKDAKTDDVVLRDLILQRATAQQHYHLMQLEEKPDKRAAVSSGKKTVEAKSKPQKSTESTAKPNEKKSGPREGCWICKGSHFAQQCPTATDAQKTEAKKRQAPFMFDA